MKVTVKILTNRKEINEAHEANAELAVKRQQQIGIADDSLKTVYDDVDVPEPITEDADLYIDASRIILAGENENGMISIIYAGTGKDYDYQIVKTDELMDLLSLRFDETADNLMKRNLTGQVSARN